jgi:hypothetical protein
MISNNTRVKKKRSGRKTRKKSEKNLLASLRMSMRQRAEITEGVV